ncbi:[LysW]-aminoadipate kinase [bacterium]|nr:[LysW]-aminoadipate kinase [bacterium]
MASPVYVVKVGGSAGIRDDELLDELAARHANGERFLLVHGGSDETNEVARQLGHPPRFVTSVSGFESRYTDRKTLEIFSMVYCGRRNKSLVEGLQQRGVNAVGLSGADGRIFEGEMKGALKIIEGGKKKVLRGDYSGKITRVHTELLELLLEGGFFPVLTPPAIDRESSCMMNVDGDRAAAELAKAFSARALIILSTVPGLLRDLDGDHSDPTNLISSIDLSSAEDPYSAAEGRMKKKIMGAQEAIDGGVEKVILSTANRPNPIRSALEGAGTTIFRSAVAAEESRI